MKKILLVLMVLLLVPIGLMAEPKPRDMVLTVVTSGPDDVVLGPAYEAFTNLTGIEVDVIVADITTGSTITIDTMIAAGEAPDVYTDYLPRTGKFVDPAYALALDDYLDLSAYNPAIIGQLKREGKHYGMMRAASA